MPEEEVAAVLMITFSSAMAANRAEIQPNVYNAIIVRSWGTSAETVPNLPNIIIIIIFAFIYRLYKVLSGLQ